MISFLSNKNARTYFFYFHFICLRVLFYFLSVCWMHGWLNAFIISFIYLIYICSVASPNDVSSDDNNANDDDNDDDDGRQKRDVLDLYSMVKCATGCDPLIFKGYGCYCGFLGSGKALDGIDR